MQLLVPCCKSRSVMCRTYVFVNAWVVNFIRMSDCLTLMPGRLGYWCVFLTDVYQTAAKCWTIRYPKHVVLGPPIVNTQEPVTLLSATRKNECQLAVAVHPPCPLLLLLRACGSYDVLKYTLHTGGALMCVGGERARKRCLLGIQALPFHCCLNSRDQRMFQKKRGW